MGVANLGYVILEMQDPAAWAKFAKDVLGFGVAKSFGAKGAKYLRMDNCLLYTSPSPRDATLSRMPSSA